MDVRQIGSATLFLTDCAEVIPDLRGVAALITDPPYGINFCHSGHAGKGITSAPARFNKTNGGYVLGDDRPFDPTPLLFLAPKLILWGANHYANCLPPSARWLVWDKVCVPRSYGSWSFADAELAWTNLKGPARMFAHLWNGCRRAGEENSFIAQRVHPTQKPVALMDWCIELCKLQPGDLVVDPYAGSGTTGVAALRRGLRFIGIELDQHHFQTAVDRLEREVAGQASRQQSELFS